VVVISRVAQDTNVIGVKDDTAWGPRETRERRPLITAGGLVDVEVVAVD
jgi:hypothetical protein